MSNVCVNCPNCRQEYQIPSHVTVMGLKCLECGTPMSSAVSKAAPREPDSVDVVTPVCQLAGGSGVPLLPVSGECEPPPRVEGPLRALRSSDQDLSSLISGMVFLVIGGLMVAFQFLAPSLKPYAHEYVIVRNILTGAAVILMAHSAAQDGIFRGLLCVVFPPYLLLYATSQEESGWLRGLFLGVMLGLCAEAFLLPDRSLILEIGPAVNVVIEQVDSWMQVASRPPV